MTSTQALGEGIAQLGVGIADANVLARLMAYLTLLEKWNRTHNLTAIREPQRMVTHHLLDSLAVLPHLPTKSDLRIIDIGSGGGLPGIPLAIMRPGWHITLLDSNHKKASFLQQAAIELPLANVEVIAQRAEDYAPRMLFDVAISRAFADLASFARIGSDLLSPGGSLIAMKGVYPHEELGQLPPDIRVQRAPALRIPGLDGERHLIVMDRVGLAA